MQEILHLVLILFKVSFGLDVVLLGGDIDLFADDIVNFLVVVGFLVLNNQFTDLLDLIVVFFSFNSFLSLQGLFLYITDIALAGSSLTRDGCGVTL